MSLVMKRNDSAVAHVEFE